MFTITPRTPAMNIAHPVNPLTETGDIFLECAACPEERRYCCAGPADKAKARMDEHKRMCHSFDDVFVVYFNRPQQ